MDLVRGEGSAKGKQFPRIPALGSDCYNKIRDETEKTLQTLEEWKEVTKSTDF